MSYPQAPIFEGQAIGEKLQQLLDMSQTEYMPDLHIQVRNNEGVYARLRLLRWKDGTRIDPITGVITIVCAFDAMPWETRIFSWSPDPEDFPCSNPEIVKLVVGYPDLSQQAA